jgi:phosphoglycerate kinase
MKLRSIKNVPDLAGKRVLVRVDFNVPVTDGRVEDIFRIQASVPTIQWLMEQDARVLLITHLGRPEGVVVKKLQVDPVARELEKILKKKVPIIRSGDWSKLSTIEKEWGKIKNGSVAIVDNIRFAEGEEKNKTYFAKELASFGDFFVLDGFGVSHRESPSVTGIADFLPSFAGLLLEKEVVGLEKVFDAQKKTSVLVIGGIKMETKLPLMVYLKNKVGKILLGGGIANTLLKAQGYGVGGSVVDSGLEKEIKKIKTRAMLEYPMDVVVGMKNGSGVRVVQVGKSPGELCKKGEAIFDIGPRTIRKYATYLRSAETIIWNGAMGYFEQRPYDTGTLSIARLVASRSRGRAYGVVGGGETVQALHRVEMHEYVDVMSTGGGAMLEFLSGKKLPGIEIVRKK